MRLLRYTVVSLAPSLVLMSALTGCGGSTAAPTGASSPSGSTTTVRTTAAETPTPTASSSADLDAAYVTDFNTKVEAGDYTPPKGVKKDQAAAKKYLTTLGDERLALAGRFACTAKKQGTSRTAFIASVMQNSGTEEAFKQLTPLAWDEAAAIFCP